MQMNKLPWMSLGALALALTAMAPASAQEKSVAVTAIVEHPALDSVRDGVQTALKAAGRGAIVTLKVYNQRVNASRIVRLRLK